MSTGYMTEKDTKCMIQFITENPSISKKTIHNFLNWMDNTLYTTGCGYDPDVIFDRLEDETNIISHLSQRDRRKLYDVFVVISELAEYSFTWPEFVSHDLWEHNIITKADLEEEGETETDPQPFQ